MTVKAAAVSFWQLPAKYTFPSRFIVVPHWQTDPNLAHAPATTILNR